MPDQNETVDKIFCAAIEIADLAQRDEFVEKECDGSEELKKKVQLMLGAHDNAGEFLLNDSIDDWQANQHDTVDLPPIEEGPGTVIGEYKLMETIGEGGMGIVYVADQRQPVRRRVALKIIKPGLDTREVMDRFEAERQALALMDHPNIAKVFDGGATRTGRPYFVMELVRGIPITKFCDQNKLPGRDRLKLFVDVCHAIQHAHQKGIIHRDIKPGNVLISLYDGEPVAKVIDFGVAKAINQQLTERTIYTKFSQILGTPAYMSPEQAELSGLDIDTRTDVYSLGVLLYELLTGETPFDRRRLKEAAYDEMRRIIREENPPKPSSKVSTLGVSATSNSQLRGTNPRHLCQQLRGDLDWIVMKSLEKDRSRRYETANGFALDVQRYLDEQPVLAGPPSRGYRLRKFIYRNRVGVLAASLVAFALLLGVIGTSSGMFWALFQQKQTQEALRRETNALAKEKKSHSEAQNAKRLAQTRADETRMGLIDSYVDHGTRLMADGDLMGSLVWFTEALSLDQGDKDREDVHRTRIAAVLRRCPRLTQIWFHQGNVHHAEFSPNENHVVTASSDNRARVWNATNGELITTLGHDKSVRHASFSPDGAWVATASLDNTARVWNARTGIPVTPPLKHEAGVVHVSFSPNGLRVVTGSFDQTARVWDVATGRPVSPPLKHNGRGFVMSAVFSADGKRLLTASRVNAPVPIRGGEVKVWEVNSGKLLTEFAEQPFINLTSVVYFAAFSADRNRFISAHSNRAQVRETANGKAVELSLAHGDEVTWASFSPDGTRVATASNDGQAVVWNAKTGRPIAHPMVHNGKVIFVCFSSDNTRLLTSTSDGTARVWDSLTSQPLSPPMKHGGPVTRAVFSSDGRRVLTASRDGTARIWDLARGQPSTSPLMHDNGVWEAAFSPNGKHVVTASLDSTARIWDAGTGMPVGLPMMHSGMVMHASVSPDSQRIVTSSGRDDHQGRVWDATTGKVLAVLPHKAAVWRAWFSPNNERVVTTTILGKAARVWDATTGQPVAAPLQHPAHVPQALFSPVGDRILTACYDNTARIWNVETGKEVVSSFQHDGPVFNVCFSPDGGQIATASLDHTARVWDSNSGRPITPPLKHLAAVRSVQFSPDGNYLVTASNDHTAQVWNATNGKRVAMPMRHNATVSSARFSPDGRFVFTASFDFTARLWDATSGRPVTPSFKHQGVVSGVRFSPDGRHAVTASRDGTARIWELHPDQRPINNLRAIGQLLSGHRIHKMGSPVAMDMDDLQTLFKQLRSSDPTEFVSSSKDIIGWHRREAERYWRKALAEVAIDAPRSKETWVNAIRHLDAVCTANPQNMVARYMRGWSHAELGQWEKASSDFAKRIDLGGANRNWAYWQAMTLVAARDLDNYRKLIEQILQKPSWLAPPPSFPDNMVAWTCVLGPQAVADFSLSIRLAEKAVEAQPNPTNELNTLGALHCRAGHFELAIEKLKQSLELRNGEANIYDWVFLAMSYHGLGQTNEARLYLDKARQAPRQESFGSYTNAWHIRLEPELLLREAEAIIRGK